jgi:hypothetical protein
MPNPSLQGCIHGVLKTELPDITHITATEESKSPTTLRPMKRNPRNLIEAM